MTRQFAILATLLLGACRPQTQVGSPATPSGRATIRDAAGTSLGDLVLTSSATGVKITGSLTSVPAGTHGIHLHAVGKCEPSGFTRFTSAGSHMNPANAHHGLDHPSGPHAGDLPNITASSSGTVSVDLTAPRVTLDASGAGGLFDADGTAIVIHASADDQKTDPAGNSGARIACGVVERR